MIDKITGLNGMKSLKILSAGRNYIKTISGLVSQVSGICHKLNCIKIVIYFIRIVLLILWKSCG